MPFHKGNKLGARKKLDRALDKEAIAFKGYAGQKENLKFISGWQERLREFVDQLVAENLSTKND